MIIVLVVALGLSFLCAVTLVSACVLSGQRGNHAEESSYLDHEQQSAKSPAVPLPTTPVPFA